MKKRIYRKAGWMVCAILIIMLCGCNNKAENIKPEKIESEKIESEIMNTTAPQEEEQSAEGTAFQVVKEMKIGWNLGNTLDSCDFKKTGINSTLNNKTPEEYYETLWGNPITTKKMIDTVAEAGFGAIRIPVSYYDHVDENFQIRKEWLDRVEEIVNYVLDNNLYCVINLHHEGVWLTADQADLEINEERLRTLWEQISERFKGYDNHLIFEGFNEIQDKEKHWSDADSSAYDAVNQLNQTFVDTVRNSTGFNKERCLIVNTYAAAVDKATLEQFQLPEDILENHLIVQIHTYTPQVFTWTEKEVTWATVRDNWDEKSDTAELDDILERLNNRFTTQGIPVIIGEFGAWNKDNIAERIKYAEYMVSAARKYNITCFWWDSGGTFVSEKDIHTSILLNRNNATWYYPELVAALVNAEGGVKE